MAHLIEFRSYENPDGRITIRRSSIEEIVPVSPNRTDLRMVSGRSVAVDGDYRSIADKLENFIELDGERRGAPHLINPETVEQVETSSEGWCRIYVNSGRSYYVKGERYDISLQIHIALSAGEQVDRREPAPVVPLRGLASRMPSQDAAGY